MSAQRIAVTPGSAYAGAWAQLVRTLPYVRPERALDVGPGDVVLVIGAHPDDETFGAGAGVASLTRAGCGCTPCHVRRRGCSGPRGTKAGGLGRPAPLVHVDVAGRRHQVEVEEQMMGVDGRRNQTTVEEPDARGEPHLAVDLPAARCRFGAQPVPAERDAHTPYRPGRGRAPASPMILSAFA
jgi:hypothetical protein